MPVETANFISELIPAYPAGTEPEKEGDNHLRTIKGALQGTFPNASKAFYFPFSKAQLDADYALLASDDNSSIGFINTAARTLTLPATPRDGYTLIVTKVTDNAFAVTISGGTFIDTATSKLLRWRNDTIFLRYSTEHAKWFYIRNVRGFDHYVATAVDLTVDSTHHQSVIEVTTTGGARTITLPSTVPTGFTCWVVKQTSDVNAVVVSAAAGINGLSTFTLPKQHMMVELKWSGTQWRVPLAEVMLKRLGGQEILGGFTAASFPVGNVGSGTFTPNPLNGNKQHYSNNGSHAIGPPADPCNIEIEVTNISGAGATTYAAFTKVDGSISAVVGEKFILDVRVTENYSYLGIKALQ